MRLLSWIERERERETDRQTDRQTDRDRERDRESRSELIYLLSIYLPAHAKLEREMMSLRDWDRLLSEHALMDTKVFSRIKKAVKRFVTFFLFIAT